MGTNYYADADLTQHIGKRSGAGPYCFDCMLTLCLGGVTAVHTGKSSWATKCPKCRREIGNLPAGEKKYACSFTWAVKPTVLPFTVYNEYGESCIREDFQQMLTDTCPIQFFDMIGREFC